MSQHLPVVPGIGIGAVAIGHSRARVAELLGPSSPGSPGEALYCDGTILVEFDDGDTVDFIQVGFDLTVDQAVTIDGIRLNGRAYDDVIDELAAAGIVGTETDIGHDFSGWGVFTMDSLMVLDVDSERPDDERSLTEGVWVGRSR